ncbi:MAG: DNA-binding protein [Bacteroidales bacterium]|nr:MAG: DNA-binding protein [Bacteroidales bacterium]
MKEIFSKRLKSARKMLGLSMDKLVERMDGIVSKNAISKYENAEMMPNSTVLLALCNALGVKPDYMFRPFSLELGEFEFRKKASLGVKDINRIKGEISDYIERYFELEEITAESHDFINPVSNINILNFDDVETAAAKLRKDWKLGNSSIDSVVELLEYNNIKVIEIEAPEKFDGSCTLVNNQYPVIVLNKNYSNERKRFTALHELGHLVLDIANSADNKVHESYCNRFAGALLLAQDVVYKTIGTQRHRVSTYELDEIQKKYGISIDAIMYRLKDLRVITANNHRYFCIRKNKEKSFKSYVEQSRYNTNEVSNRFNRLLAKSISEELISYSKAAAISLRTVNELKQDIILA